jgi:hypothetical protein
MAATAPRGHSVARSAIAFRPYRRHSERARSAGPSTARRPPTRDLGRRAFDKGNVYGMAANAETDHLALEIG